VKDSAKKAKHGAKKAGVLAAAELTQIASEVKPQAFDRTFQENLSQVCTAVARHHTRSPQMLGLIVCSSALSRRTRMQLPKPKSAIQGLKGLAQSEAEKAGWIKKTTSVEGVESGSEVPSADEDSEAQLAENPPTGSSSYPAQEVVIAQGRMDPSMISPRTEMLGCVICLLLVCRASQMRCSLAVCIRAAPQQRSEQ
jgi:hypothetical protein